MSSALHIIYVKQTLSRLLAMLANAADLAFRIGRIKETMLGLMLLDLEPAREELTSYYSNRRGGSKPRDPVAMLRCLILMAMMNVTSLNDWSARLKGEPELAVLCGFKPGDAPGVGTLYDFCGRVEDGPYEEARACGRTPRSKRRKGLRGRFRRNLRNEKKERKQADNEQLARENETKTKHLALKLAEQLESAAGSGLSSRLNKILLLCGFIPAAASGLTGCIDGLVVSGDGSALPSQASSSGSRTCSCSGQGKARCGCDRIYSDPSATWGWDHYLNRFYFGYRFHVLQCRTGEYELPLHVMTAAAHEADVIMGMQAMVNLYQHLRELAPGARIKAAVFDCGYDATYFYWLINRMLASPVIPLTPRHGAALEAGGIPRSADGTPLCSEGCPMRRHSFDNNSQCTVYNCPAKKPTHKDGKRVYIFHPGLCPLGEPCDPNSSLGPFVRLSLDDNPRLNLRIPRGSEKFKKLYSQRTSTERFNSFCKVAGKAGRRPYRRQHLFAINLLCQALHRYAQAFVRATYGKDLRGKDVIALMKTSVPVDSAA